MGNISRIKMFIMLIYKQVLMNIECIIKDYN
jgi:hypothetical protein